MLPEEGVRRVAVAFGVELLLCVDIVVVVEEELLLSELPFFSCFFVFLLGLYL